VIELLGTVLLFPIAVFIALVAFIYSAITLFYGPFIVADYLLQVHDINQFLGSFIAFGLPIILLSSLIIRDFQDDKEKLAIDIFTGLYVIFFLASPFIFTEAYMAIK
jgi:hypothetical protein